MLLTNATGQSGVLILVLVDVGLGHEEKKALVFVIDGLNPCFSGCWSRTARTSRLA